MRLLDITGQRFERLQVISSAGKDKNGNLYWLCRCDCGVERAVQGSNLKNGSTRSCGCLQRQLTSERFTTHGESESLEYQIYADAKKRCTNSSHKHFCHYGGRGIKFLFNGFEEFLAHIGPKPGKEYSLDRINNEGHYEIGNIRWATLKVQSRNRRSNCYLTYQNETLCIADWAKKLGFNYTTIRERIKLGWSVERTLSTPVRARPKL